MRIHCDEFGCEEKVAVEKDLAFRLQRIKEIESGMPQKAGTFLCYPFLWKEMFHGWQCKTPN